MKTTLNQEVSPFLDLLYTARLVSWYNIRQEAEDKFISVVIPIITMIGICDDDITVEWSNGMLFFRAPRHVTVSVTADGVLCQSWDRFSAGVYSTTCPREFLRSAAKMFFGVFK